MYSKLPLQHSLHCLTYPALIYCSIHNLLMIKHLKNNPLAFLSDIKLFVFNLLKIIL